MKKFWFAIWILLCAAIAVCSVSASAGGSVVFVKTGGEGDGSSADSPCGTIKEAYAALGSAGGTVVICGDYAVDTTLNFPTHTALVKLTSVYDGVDYRETSDAALHNKSDGFIKLNGPTEIDGLFMKLDKNAAGLAANFHPLTIGYDFEVGQTRQDTAYRLYLVGGANNDGSVPVLGPSRSNEIKVFSGRYIMASTFSRSMSHSHEGTVTLTLGGTANVRDMYLGAMNGGRGGTSILNLTANAKVSKLFLNGHLTTDAIQEINGSVTVSATENAVISSIVNYDQEFFPNGTRTLRYTSTVSLPEDFANCFDTVELIKQPAVVYLKTGGEGDGSSAASPVGTVEAAYALLEGTGGTIVVCGKYTVAETVNFPEHTEPVKLTSVYGGVDYREEPHNAALHNTSTGFIKLNGPTEIDKLFMKLDKSTAGLAINFHPLTIGYDFEVGSTREDRTSRLYFVGGSNNDLGVPALGEGETNEIKIYSGLYTMISTFGRSEAKSHEGTVTLTLGGTANVKDLYLGALGTGGVGGTSVLNMIEDAQVSNRLFLNGNTPATGKINGSVTINASGNARIQALLNSGKENFPNGERTLNYTSAVSLPDSFEENFDEVNLTVFVQTGGAGDGTSADKAFGTMEAAYGALEEAGGMIVICGDYAVSAGNAKFPTHTQPVKLTSVFCGVDYREASYNAALHNTTNGFIKLNGPTEIDGLFMKLDESVAGLAANFHPLTIGYDFAVGTAPDDQTYRLYLVGGSNNDPDVPVLDEGSSNEIQVYSGRYIMASTFSRSEAKSHKGTVTLTLGGSADVRDLYLGALSSGASGGTSILNLIENARVTKLYLNGNSSATAINGSVTINASGNASISSIVNYDKALFPNGERTLNYTSTVSLPDNFSECFDTTRLQGVKEVSISGIEAGNVIHALADTYDVTALVRSAGDGVSITYPDSLTDFTLILTIKDSGGYKVNTYTVTGGAAVMSTSVPYDGSVIYVFGGANGNGLTAETACGSLEDAYPLLLTGGGTVVVCGELPLTVRTQLPEHSGAITITSVYGGKDYREDGARIYFPASATYILGGETVFRDITIDLDVSGVIAASFHKLTFDTGVTVHYDCSLVDENGLYITGGDSSDTLDTGKTYDQNPDITLKSGNVSRLVAFSRYSGAREHTGTAAITLQGDAYVRYLYTGAVGDNATANSAVINIEDDVIIENLNIGGAQTNPMNGSVTLNMDKIDGGDVYEFDTNGLYTNKGGVILNYDPRTVPSGILFMADLAHFDKIQTICERDGAHVFGEPFVSPFDASMTLHTCEVCGYAEMASGVAPDPVGEHVVFVADGGFGDGSHPAMPLGSYEDAYTALGSEGGTIVLVGKCTISSNTIYKHDSVSPSFFREPAHKGRVFVTSVYDGVDYREKGAKFVFGGDIDYKLYGPVTFDNIVFDAAEGTTRNQIAARYYPIVFGDDCEMLRGVDDGYKLDLIGGYQYFRYTDFTDVEFDDYWLILTNHVIPVDPIVLIDQKNVWNTNAVMRVEAAEAFERMFTEMEAQGLKVPTISIAFESYEWKYDFFTRFMGRVRRNMQYDFDQAFKYVNASCNVPGYGEHHLGLCCDMFDPDLPYGSNNNSYYYLTKESDWILEHGADYGIILREPPNTSPITGYSYEAWHFRYIGVENALAYRAGGFTTLEYFDGVKYGLFAQDSDVTVRSGTFNSILGGSRGCDDITFTGTNAVKLSTRATAANVEDQVALLGDADSDGQVDQADIQAILEHMTDASTEISEIDADYNADGQINLLDALLALRSILGI